MIPESRLTREIRRERTKALLFMLGRVLIAAPCVLAGGAWLILAAVMVGFALLDAYFAGRFSKMAERAAELDARALARTGSVETEANSRS